MLGHHPAHVYTVFGHSTSWGDLVTKEAAWVDNKLTILTRCWQQQAWGAAQTLQMGRCARGRNTFGENKPRGSAGSLCDPTGKYSGSLGGTCMLATRIEGVENQEGPVGAEGNEEKGRRKKYPCFRRGLTKPFCRNLGTMVNRNLLQSTKG